MELLRIWIIGVTVTAMALAAAQALMPEGAVKRASRLTAGLALILSLLQPLAALDTGDLEDLTTGLPDWTITEEANDPMKTIIEEELAAYIEEQAGQLGLFCCAEVTCRIDENGVPLPGAVSVTGVMTAAQRKTLSDLIARDLGVLAEGQTFREE